MTRILLIRYNTLSSFCNYIGTKILFREIEIPHKCDVPSQGRGKCSLGNAGQTIFQMFFLAEGYRQLDIIKKIRR